MKNRLAFSLLLLGSLWLLPAWAQGAAADTVLESWHAKSVGEALGLTALFAGFGIGLAILGYKIFDYCTPGDLHKEIVEHKNLAAAIIGAAIILGVCLIVAAAIMGSYKFGVGS